MATQLFFVTALSQKEAVKAKVEEVIPDTAMRYELAPDRWVLAYEGTPTDLAQKLGIRGDPHVGSGLVMTFGTYSGRAPSTFWEWLKARGD